MIYLKILTLVLVLILGGVAVYILAHRTSFHNPTSQTPSTQSATPSAAPIASSAASSANISVDTPKANQTVSSPVHISGQARVFESVVSYKIVDSNGKQLATGNTTAKAPDAGGFGAYQVDVSFQVGSVKTGTVEVFQKSAKDGSEIDKVNIPVTFK